MPVGQRKRHEYSAWIVESSRFLDVPTRSFQPDVGGTRHRGLAGERGNHQVPDGKITLYDTGWKQLEYIFDRNTSCCWELTARPDEAIGLDPNHVSAIVIGHGHWDHSGQLSDVPNAVLYIQKQELKQIDFFLNYPTEFNRGHIRAVNTRPAHRKPSRTPTEGLRAQPRVRLSPADGERDPRQGTREGEDHRWTTSVEPGMIIHPRVPWPYLWSQLLQVNTAVGQLVFGSDTYSSWTGIRDWLVANIQQTDTIQQFLAYEKCYVLTSKKGGFNNCIAAHEPAHTRRVPDHFELVEHPWRELLPRGRAALANGEPTHVPASPNKVKCVSLTP